MGKIQLVRFFQNILFCFAWMCTFSTVLLADAVSDARHYFPAIMEFLDLTGKTDEEKKIIDLLYQELTQDSGFIEEVKRELDSATIFGKQYEGSLRMIRNIELAEEKVKVLKATNPQGNALFKAINELNDAKRIYFYARLNKTCSHGAAWYVLKYLEKQIEYSRWDLDLKNPETFKRILSYYMIRERHMRKRGGDQVFRNTVGHIGDRLRLYIQSDINALSDAWVTQEGVERLFGMVKYKNYGTSIFNEWLTKFLMSMTLHERIEYFKKGKTPLARVLDEIYIKTVFRSPFGYIFKDDFISYIRDAFLTNKEMLAKRLAYLQQESSSFLWSGSFDYPPHWKDPHYWQQSVIEIEKTLNALSPEIKAMVRVAMAGESVSDFNDVFTIMTEWMPQRIPERNQQRRGLLSYFRSSETTQKPLRRSHESLTNYFYILSKGYNIDFGPHPKDRFGKMFREEIIDRLNALQSEPIGNGDLKNRKIGSWAFLLASRADPGLYQRYHQAYFEKDLIPSIFRARRFSPLLDQKYKEVESLMDLQANEVLIELYFKAGPAPDMILKMEEYACRMPWEPQNNLNARKIILKYFDKNSAAYARANYETMFEGLKISDRFRYHHFSQGMLFHENVEFRTSVMTFTKWLLDHPDQFIYHFDSNRYFRNLLASVPLAELSDLNRVNAYKIYKLLLKDWKQLSQSPNEDWHYLPETMAIREALVSESIRLGFPGRKRKEQLYHEQMSFYDGVLALPVPEEQRLKLKSQQRVYAAFYEQMKKLNWVGPICNESLKGVSVFVQ